MLTNSTCQSDRSISNAIAADHPSIRRRCQIKEKLYLFVRELRRCMSRLELTSPLSSIYDAPSLIGRAHNRSEERITSFLSYPLFPVRVIHTLGLFSSFFRSQGTNAHTQTPLSNQTPISPISRTVNHSPAVCPLTLSVRPPIETKLKTRTANGEERARRPRRGGGTIPVGRGRGRAMAVGLVGWSDGWGEQRVGSLLPLGKCL